MLKGDTHTVKFKVYLNLNLNLNLNVRAHTSPSGLAGFVAKAEPPYEITVT